MDSSALAVSLPEKTVEIAIGILPGLKSVLILAVPSAAIVPLRLSPVIAFPLLSVDSYSPRLSE